MPTTIKDIARALGVDHSTVSLALRDHPRIAPPTRARIQEAATRMGYVPNRAAQTLRRGRSQTIALVVWGNNPDQLGRHFPEYVVSATKAAFSAGYQLLLLQATTERLAGASVDHLPELSQVDGALFVGETLDRPGLAALVQRGFPLVHLGERTLEGVTLPCVSADYAQGGRLAAEHLLAHGHRRLGALYRPHDHVPEIHQGRLAGFASAAGHAEVARVAVGYETPLDPVLTTLQERGVTGVFTTEQTSALWLLAACHERGIRVPDALSVVAFDDLPSAETSVPPLTCVRQPRDGVGRLGVDLLVTLIEGRTPENPRVLLPCVLVERRSVVTPKARSARTGAVRRPVRREAMP